MLTSPEAQRAKARDEIRRCLDDAIAETCKGEACDMRKVMNLSINAAYLASEYRQRFDAPPIVGRTVDEAIEEVANG